MTKSKKISYLALSAIVLSMTACSTTSQPNPQNQSTEDRIGKAVVSPLNDLNLMHNDTPPPISAALKNPYQKPEPNSCPNITTLIQQLDAVLGSDLDAVENHEKSNAEKGTQFVKDEAVGSVERTINGAIPFRGWIRKFSGAEKRSKEEAAGIAAGIVRRAYLKGVGQELGCPYPGSPLIVSADPKPSNETNKK